MLAKDVTLPLPLSAVNQAFVLWSKTTDVAGGEFSDNETVLGEITSTTTVQFRSTFTTPLDIISWQVVEFTNAADINVQKGTTAMLGLTTSVTATLSPPVDENKTFVLAGFTTTGTGVDMGSRMLRAQLTDSTTITIERSVSGTPDDITEIFWQAIELKDKSTVVRGSSTFAVAAAQVNVPIAPHLDVSQSIAFGSVQSGAGQNLGRSPFWPTTSSGWAPSRWPCPTRSSRWTGTTPWRPPRSTGSSWSSNRMKRRGSFPGCTPATG